ncbi:hypothetical protein BV25DRAFT_1175068 [Artomyces pyxidatus]|uniref:Uncharacterized protein n=1 Tax=Artomyces pyxidatus TaxID=48021 RepID=A0ACB8STB5_9AGAM|nr:hypothetical protein BV25DRAFT_1175068 [Artomyces pyxidatus]
MQPRSALRISASDLKVQDRVVACESWAVPPPIHRVPVELIRNIFLLIKAIASPEEQQDNPHLGGIRTWMAVSHVCSRWRRIALETKDFWTYIPLRARNLGSTQLALERSAPLPISFNIGYRFSMQAKYQEAAMLALRELPRARELYLWLDNGKSKDDDAAREDFVNTVDEALYSNPAPLLERFESAKGYHDRCLFLGQVPQNLRVLMLRDSEQSSISNLLQAPLKSLQLLNCEIKVLEILQAQQRGAP